MLSSHAQENLNTFYDINGFRSLRDFKITLTPGINVLVGPNGSGKTTFIDFIDFIGNVLRHGASTAVSEAGGLAKVFSQEDLKGKKVPKICAYVEGVADFYEKKIYPSVGKSFFNFEYEIEIKFSKKHSAIYISKESLKLKKLYTLDNPSLSSQPVGTILATRKSPLDEAPINWKIGSRLTTKNKRNPMTIASMFTKKEVDRLGRANKGTSQEKISEQDINLSIIQSNYYPPDASFLTRDQVPALELVKVALTRGQSFNIIPEKSRQPDELTRPPYIGKDGSGLSATLHALQKAQDRKGPPQYVRTSTNKLVRIERDGLEMVTEWARLVYPHLQSISVSQDPHTGKFLCNLIVGEAPSLKIPIQSASDGTVKWLALTCLIITLGGVYSLEEPENFLHPKMQQYLVRLIRDSLEEDPRAKYFIVSTHSETLINQFKAEELILFNFEEGKTNCGRIRSPEKVKKEINETGFGLGYYYASNTLT